MSKTRRNINANRRHVKGGSDESGMNDHRIDRFMKKMEKRTSTYTRDQDDEDSCRVKIDHTNYDQFLDEDDLGTDDDMSTYDDESNWR